ncbi:hypothetical protein BX667DRAFT_515682 [Coemansia mojavensis]|nr:hypothetical protein BX667DRAFT_515682 [Coemansia mojavensis]
MHFATAATTSSVRFHKSKGQAMRCSHNQAYQCSVCGAIFDSAYAASEHPKLATKYKLPQSQLEEIFAYDEAERLKRQELSAKVAHAAQQRYSNCRCDWEAVAQELDMPLLECLDLYGASQSSVSPSQRECLEANESNEGKSHWEYDPDAFSQEMADRTTQFIKPKYPSLAPANYQAVSNYMWIDKNGCYKMAKLLDGGIGRTRELKERVGCTL